MPPEAQTYLVSQCTYTQTCTLHINIIISFINSNITFSWPVVGCVLHQPTSDVCSHVYPDEGPLYVCVHYYALPLHVVHGAYTLCISLVLRGQTLLHEESGHTRLVYTLPIPLVILSLLAIKGLLVSLAQLN